MSLDNKNKSQLIAMIEQLQNEDVNATVAHLQGQVASLEGTVTNLKEQLHAANTASGDSEEVTGYQTIIKDLQQRVAAYEKTYGQQFLTAGRHLVRAKGNIMVGGKVVTPAMLESDPELLERELKKGNKMLEVVA